MAKARDEIEALGAGVVAVGRTSREQAERLESRWVPYPCLVDPRGNLYKALGIRRYQPKELLEPAKLWTLIREYARGFAHGVMQGKPSGTNQLPGVAIIDADSRLRYLYDGSAIGDYPPVEEVLDELRRIVREDNPG
ncbi:MAG: hypothetical protein KY437_07285 [Actinobacteria bacterium]|nr:hypothetical protein [Actinomycetota bacterium]